MRWSIRLATSFVACCPTLRADEPTALRAPPGFVVEQVAGPGLVERPMLAALDDEGRLYVADSAGVNLRGPELAKDPPHVIRVLEDVDGDGRYDRSRVFADKLVFPQGVLWHDGAVYCSSPPSFWRLTDRNGDGVCDERTELATGFANTGVADDMHGASLGIDGRIYWCAGRFPHSIRTPRGDLVHKGTAPLILRCRPDGSEIEVVCGAQGNAVGVAFLPAGDMFASGTYLAPEAMGADLRDAVIHAIDGAEYPVRDRVLNEHKRTGELLPPLVHLGFAAASDLTAYESPSFGDEFRDNLFVALFNMHKVVRLRVEPSGATYTCQMDDFLTTDESDFHPTDVLEDADGSLLVLNTGGWFRIGCPTSRIAKPEVLGGIYRIRRADAAKVDDPYGRGLDWKAADARELTTRLSDARPAVRRRAMAALAQRGSEALPALTTALKEESIATRLASLWTLTRIDAPSARAAVRSALDDAEPSMRQAAARSAGLWRDAAAQARLEQLATRGEAPVKREAATALGRLKSAGNASSATSALLAGLADVGDDRFLEHALIFALIQLDDPAATRAGLAAGDASTQRGALIALDQMDHGHLTVDTALPFLASTDAPLRDAALWVVRRHPEWGAAVRPTLSQWLTESPSSQSPETLAETIRAFAASPEVQQLVAEQLSDPQTSPSTRLLLLRVLGEAPLDKLPAAWSASLLGALASPDGEIVAQALATLRAAPPERRPTLERVDPVIDFSFDEGPFAGTSLDDHFCAQWTGQISVERDGDYVFHLESDDGSWLYVDDKLVIDNGGKHGVEGQSANVHLTAGSHRVRIDYQEFDGGATCRWLWDREGHIEPVPSRVLSSGGAPGLLGRYFAIPRMGRAFPDLSFTDYDPALAQLAGDAQRTLETRVAAAALLTAQARTAHFDMLFGALSSDLPPLARLQAAEALATGQWSSEQLARLAAALADVGVLELPKLLLAFEPGGDEALGGAMLQQLQHNPAASAVRPELLRQAVARFPEATRSAAEAWIASVAPTQSGRADRLAELSRGLTHGEVQRGRNTFYSAKAVCSACHRVQGQGGQIGPDLSQIGAVRADADLLESIVYPSSSFARGFEPYAITTHEGLSYQGVIRRQTSDAIYVTNSARAESRIPRAAIDELSESTVSIMPDGMDKQLTPGELADLVAFLRSLR